MVNNILLMHVPQNPFNKNSFIQAAPIGLIGLGSYIKQQLNINVQLCHFANLVLNGKFKDADEYVEEKGFDLVGLDLHWHYQSYSVLRVCKLLKQLKKPPIIVLGGFTASYFSSEILNTFSDVDFIIRGDGEEPFVQLITALNSKNSDFSEVSNLAWRFGGKVETNDISFSVSSEFLNKLNDGDLSLYGDDSKYQGFIYGGQGGAPHYFLPVGRGCSLSCSYCAGSLENQKVCYNRNNVVFRSPERVVDIIKNVLEYHINHFYICFDPPEMGDNWYCSLFNIIRKRNLKIGLSFECYSIPSERFIEEFARTFDLVESRLIFSPTSISDNDRNKFTSQRYKFEEFENILEKCKAMNINTSIYFALLPGEEDTNWSQFKNKVDWIKETNSNKSSVTVLPIMLEPGAPWYEKPEKYSIEPELKNFSDFYNFHMLNMSSNSLGYKFQGFKNKLIFFNSIKNNEISDSEIVSKQLKDSISLVFVDDVNGLISLERSNFNFENKKVIVIWENRNIKLFELFNSIDKELCKVSAVRILDKHEQCTFSEIMPQIKFVDMRNHKFACYSEKIVRQRPILKDECMWIGSNCPALEMNSVGVDKNGEFHFCNLDGPKFYKQNIQAPHNDIKRSFYDIYKERGCEDCIIQEECPKCINVKDYSQYCKLHKENRDAIKALKVYSENSKLICDYLSNNAQNEILLPIENNDNNILMFISKDLKDEFSHYIFNKRSKVMTKVGKDLFYILLASLIKKVELKDEIKLNLPSSNGDMVDKIMENLRKILG